MFYEYVYIWSRWHMYMYIPTTYIHSEYRYIHMSFAHKHVCLVAAKFKSAMGFAVAPPSSSPYLQHNHLEHHFCTSWRHTYTCGKLKFERNSHIHTFIHAIRVYVRPGQYRVTWNINLLLLGLNLRISFIIMINLRCWCWCVSKLSNRFCMPNTKHTDQVS